MNGIPEPVSRCEYRARLAVLRIVFAASPPKGSRQGGQEPEHVKAA
jgi:hypothetical protein